MANCSECKPNIVPFPTAKALCLHLKLAHSFNISSNYKCAQTNCGRVFSSVNTFKKHLRKDHACEAPTLLTDFVPHEGDEISPGAGLIDKMGMEVDLVPDEHSMILEEFKAAVHSEAEIFVSKFYSKQNLPRNIVQNIIDDSSSFLSSGFLSVMKDKVLKAMNTSGAHETAITEISEMFGVLEDPFDHLRTEHKRFQNFTQSGDYIPSVPYLLGRRLEKKNGMKEVTAEYKNIYGHSIPLRFVLQKFLELPDALKHVLEYMEYLKSDTTCYSHFIQGDLWQKKKSRYNPSDIVLPLFVYFDDFEANNPLGPHSGKMGEVYVSIPCLPPECQSLVENIFLALLFLSKDRDEFGNRKCFAPLIEELSFLETVGIDIDTGSVMQHVFFVLGLVIGDNLGVNCICGFVASFRATYFCRFCKTPRAITECQVEADPLTLRDPLNYQEDLQLQNVTLTGLKEDCVFNQIPSFNVTENDQLDVMHDIEEGQAHYIMLYLLRHYILEKRFFTLADLNFRMQMFEFGPIDSSNKPPKISDDNLINGTKLKMTASETLCFIRYFGSIIGDLVPYGDPNWKLYLALMRVTNIAMAKVLPRDIIPLFSTLIKELNELYLELTKSTLKPKFHLFTH